MFTNQWRMSALQCVPSETRDHFPLLCVLKSHYAITSLLAPLVFIVKYGREKPANITIDYFPSCWGTLGFCCCFFFLFPCPGSQGSVFKASTFQKCSCIQMTYLTEPKTTFKAPLSCEHAVHVTSWNSTWHEAPTLALRIMRRECGYGNFPCQDVSVSLCLFLSLAGVNGASFCLVQHPCYFDVMAIPLPDQ